MNLGASALAFPAGAALVLWSARGTALLDGAGARSFEVLAATGGAGLLASALARWLRRRTAPARLSAEVRTFADAVTSALGDAFIAFDLRGRIVDANGAAAALAASDPGELAGRAAGEFGPDLPILLRGLGRGPASGRLLVQTPAGAVPARAVAVRLPGGPPVDVAVIRVDPPHALIEQEPPARSGVVERRGAGDEQLAVSSAIAAELREPLSRACAAASTLRLVLPRAGKHLVHLEALEAALARSERRLATLLAAGEVGRMVPVEIAPLVSELLAGLTLPRGLRVSERLGPGTALADAGHLRQALRHLFRAAAAAMPAGGELSVALARRRPNALVLEISDTGARPVPSPELPLAMGLLRAQGCSLEIEAVPGRGTICRIMLPTAPAAHPSAPEGPAAPAV